MGLKIVNLKIHSPICKEALWKWKREALVHAKHLVPVNFQVLDVECAWCNEWPHQSTMWVASSNWGVRKPPQFLTKIKHFSEVSGVPNFEMHPCKACRRFRDTATRFIKKVGLSKPANHIKKVCLKWIFFSESSTSKIACAHLCRLNRQPLPGECGHGLKWWNDLGNLFGLEYPSS